MAVPLGSSATLGGSSVVNGMTAVSTTPFSFPSSISLSGDSTVNSVLAEIPFFSVGLLGFAIITFLFILARLSQPTLYVIASTLLAFLGAIFDLSQLLTQTRGGTVTATTASGSVIALIIARELVFAASVSARFFYFFRFVSEPPRGELAIRRNNSTPDHSGMWSRWGYIGTVLKYSMLMSCFTIVVLQVLWRLGGELSYFSPVYHAESILEIALSVLLIFKLFLNAWISPLLPRWKIVRNYLPVIVAILIGVGIALGNLADSHFSESTLGRFLQAIELYILILYVLTAAFYKVDLRTLSPRAQRRTTTILPLDMGPNAQRSDGAPSRASGPSQPRPSTASRIASFISRRVSSRPREDDQRQLWKTADVERQDTSPPSANVAEKRLSAASSVPTIEISSWKDNQVITSFPRSPRSQMTDDDITFAPAPLQTKIALPRPSSFDFDRILAETKLGAVAAGRISRTESPVYGLEGIIKSLDIAAAASDEEALRREQAALDRSMAGLQRFSSKPPPRPAPAPTRLPVSPREPVAGPSNTLSDGRSGLARNDSLPGSYMSDISLSRFPSPPATLRDFRAAGLSGVGSRADSYFDPNTLVEEDIPFTLVPPRMPAVDSEMRVSTETYRRDRPTIKSTVTGTESGITQWDVTSFIGDLYTPAASRPAPTPLSRPPITIQPPRLLPDLPTNIRQSESDDPDSPSAAKIVNVRRAGTINKEMMAQSNKSGSSVALTSSSEGTQLQGKSPVDPPSVPSIPSPIKATAPAPATPPQSQKPVITRSRSVRRQLPISGPIPKDEQPLSYERPRRAPAAGSRPTKP